ncbi:MAG: hypothetical protein KJ728_10085 [Alphaproteobacteria bacterium]|nr:hypothetical protein [Alphaproteobacteria bacterium]MBU1521758.1 hypothetical protein [Alphaproteobacteria bacterium]MBU2030579.1 hypothetical protein [Alphaproteobacteria bacterium]MBU2163668.1 hypothetical protein [Alphaproteobacteria bacterium]MBU2232386.1 hypothetical protein [Alphaproteobacteria bacterium]
MAAACVVAAHAGLVLVMTAARPEPLAAPHEAAPVMVELVDPPPPPTPIPAPDPAPTPDAPAAAAQTPAPPKPAPQLRPPAVAAARPRKVVAKPPPDVEPLPAAPAPPGPPLPLLGAAQLAGAATVGSGPGGGAGNGVGGAGGTGGSGAGSGSGGGTCDMVRWVQDAVRDDAAVRRAVIAASEEMNASGRAILVWNGDWLQSRNQSGKGLAGVRQAIALEVAFAPAECRTQRMTGLAVLKLEDGADGARIALGKGSWRWSDLLGAG